MFLYFAFKLVSAFESLSKNLSLYVVNNDCPTDKSTSSSIDIPDSVNKHAKRLSLDLDKINEVLDRKKVSNKKEEMIKTATDNICEEEEFEGEMVSDRDAISKIKNLGG
jgi:hypothetical protein